MLQENAISNRTEFQIKRSAKIINFIPLAYLVIATSFIYWPVSLVILAIGVFILLLWNRLQLVAGEQGIYYRPFFRLKRVKWEDISRVKVNILGGCSIFWDEKSETEISPPRHHLSGKKTLNINKDIQNFKRLLRIVIDRSVNADIDPSVFEIFHTPKRQRMVKYGRIFGTWFLLLLAVSVLMLLTMAVGDASLNHDKVIIVFLLLLVGGVSGKLFSLMIGVWDEGDKWSELNLVYDLILYSHIFYIFIIFNYTLVLWLTVSLTAILAFSVLIFYFPTLSRGKIAGLIVVFSLLAAGGGKICLHNPDVERSVIKRFDDFHCTDVGWFPDGQRIWIAGTKNYFNEEAEEDIFVLEVANGDIVHRMSCEKIIPGFSFYWGPEGDRLALIEYPMEEDDNKADILSLMDVDSFEKTPAVEEKGISLHKSGCWNKDGNKLVGVYRNAESDNYCRRTVFLFDVKEQLSSELVEKDGLKTAFWLPDDTIGILHTKPKQSEEDNKKRRQLNKYKVSRLNQHSGDTEELYATEEYHTDAHISPCGKYLFVKTEENRPLIADVMAGDDVLLDEQLTNSPRYRTVTWAPDDSTVLLLVDRNGEKVRINYEPRSEKTDMLSSDHITGIINWSADSEHFLGFNDKQSLYTPLKLFSKKRSAGIEIARRGGILSVLENWAASLSPEGDRVIHSDLSYSLRKDTISIDTKIFLSEIKKESLQ